MLTLLLGGCRTAPGTVRVDLLAYLARSAEWAPREAEAATAIRRILATEFVDEAEVQRQIADNRPRLLEHLERIRAYEPRSPPVERLHAKYVDAWEQLLKGFDAIERGFETGDYRRLAAGRVAMEAWRDTIRDVARELRRLADEYRVDPRDATAART